VPEHFNIPWRKSIDEGLFAAQNIELYWKDFKEGTGAMVKALQKNELDLAILLTEGAVKAIAENADFKILQIYVNSPLDWGVFVDFHSSLNTLQDVKDPEFAISRYGSGSHLMAYLLSEREQFNKDRMSFHVVDNIVGAIKHLEKNKEHLFLWENFMTKPYVDAETLKKIGNIPTPWASFCIVAKNDLINRHPLTLMNILQLISSYTYKFKQHAVDSVDYLSNFFEFEIEDMKKWLELTDWNYMIDDPKFKIEKAITYLKKLQLVDQGCSAEKICVDSSFWNSKTT